MKIKSLLVTVSLVAGLSISTFTAFMTYFIIGEPIGMKMFSKITLMVLLTLPIIVLFSYIIGQYLSKKVHRVTQRLDAITENNFEQSALTEYVKDFQHIHLAISSLSRRLEQAIKAHKQNSKNLEDMIQAFAHDIKTPITIIGGYIEELEEDTLLSSDKDHAIHVIQKELDFMNELSDHSLSYISSFQLPKMKEKIFLKAFVQEDIFPLLDVKVGITLINDLDDAFSLRINRLDLKQILLNLYHNANKFTQSGYIKICAQEERLILEDSGQGILKEDSEQLFEAFITDDSSKNRDHTGFGLGLAISRNLLDKNGYEIHFDAVYQKGARLIISPGKV